LTGGCGCQSDYDCLKSPYCPDKCVKSPYSSIGQCQNVVTVPTKAPVAGPPSVGPPTTNPCCPNPRNIPTECEVQLLISIMEEAVGINFALLPQWLRMSFHDAGTFNLAVPQGGANGCLLTHPQMREQPENSNLDLALNTIAAVKALWEGQTQPCLRVSNADMIQFAGWFSVIRQKDVPGLTTAKRNELVVSTMTWGRKDELNCQIEWTLNLPGFENLGASEFDVPGRCMFAGGEIKKKMMDSNGFTAMEATALMGAHTIGLTRNVFGTGGPLVSKWAHNGGDNHTPQGPVFDNGFHQYLKNDVVEDDASAFAGNILAFDVPFPAWFRETATGIGHLDTDVALAFPSVDTNVHPNFHTFTAMFASDNALFMKEFVNVFRKMTALGVVGPLAKPLDCSAGCTNNSTSPLNNSTSPANSTTLTDDVQILVEQEIDLAILFAVDQLNATEEERADEIAELIVELDPNDFIRTGVPTPSPSSGTTPTPPPTHGFGGTPPPTPGFGGFPTPPPTPDFGGTPPPTPGFGGFPTPPPTPGFGGFPTPPPTPGFGGFPTPSPNPGFGGFPTPSPNPVHVGFSTPTPTHPSFGSFPTPTPTHPSFGSFPTPTPTASGRPN
jgi:hypothetical protein